MTHPITQPVLDLLNPTQDMFMRNGENPLAAIVAVVPDHSELVTDALQHLHATLTAYMEPEKITLLLQKRIRLNSGQIIDLGLHSVFFSLSYPTAQSSVFEMELAPPVNATIH